MAGDPQPLVAHLDKLDDPPVKPVEIKGSPIVTRWRSIHFELDRIFRLDHAIGLSYLIRVLHAESEVEAIDEEPRQTAGHPALRAVQHDRAVLARQGLALTQEDLDAVRVDSMVITTGTTEYRRTVGIAVVPLALLGA